MPERQLLFAVYGIVSGIEIDDDFRRLTLPRAYKCVDEKFIESRDAFDLSATNFEEDVSVFDWLLGFTASERMLEPIDGGPAGELAIILSRINANKRFEERIMPQYLSIIAVGVTGENLLDLLPENLLGGVSHKEL